MASQQSPAQSDEAEASAEQRLLTSALTLFSEKGYDATSIREIIERAGVTRPVLYYYFVNKEDLFRRLVEQCFNDMAAEFGRVSTTSGNCRDKLVALMSAAFDFVEHSPETIRLIVQIFFSPPRQGPKLNKNDLWYTYRFRHVSAVMKEGMGTGELGAGDAETLAWVFIGIMDMHVMTKTNLPGAHLTHELAEGLVDLFVNGAAARLPSVESVKSPFQH